MKDLKLNKERLTSLCDDNLENIIGAGPGVDIPGSCTRKSCDRDPEPE